MVAMVKKEMELLNEIRLRLQEHNIKTFRLNVGKVRMSDGRYFDTGLPKGTADLEAIRPDGVACWIETKIKPNKPSVEQCNFILAMINQGCPAGLAFSVEDALEIVEWSNECCEYQKALIELYLRKGAKTK